MAGTKCRMMITENMIRARIAMMMSSLRTYASCSAVTRGVAIRDWGFCAVWRRAARRAAALPLGAVVTVALLVSFSSASGGVSCGCGAAFFLEVVATEFLALTFFALVLALGESRAATGDSPAPASSLLSSAST